MSSRVSTFTMLFCISLDCANDIVLARSSFLAENYSQKPTLNRVLQFNQNRHNQPHKRQANKKHSHHFVIEILFPRSLGQNEPDNNRPNAHPSEFKPKNYLNSKHNSLSQRQCLQTLGRPRAESTAITPTRKSSKTAPKQPLEGTPNSRSSQRSNSAKNTK